MKYIKPRIPNKEIELCLDLFGKKEASKRIIEYITGVIDDSDAQFNLLNTPSGSVSLLERAVESLDDYLNAGCKDTRKDASDKAKQIYKEFHGKEYQNRNER